MSSVPAGKRLWKCPECGDTVQLSITQLDPMACESCLQKLKKGHSGSTVSANSLLESAASGFMPIVIVGFVALVLGLGIGFVAGRLSAPAPQATHSSGSSTQPQAHSPSSKDVAEEDSEGADDPKSPRPGYRWVNGYTRKDGIKVKGHWVKEHK